MTQVSSASARPRRNGRARGRRGTRSSCHQVRPHLGETHTSSHTRYAQGAAGKRTSYQPRARGGASSWQCVPSPSPAPPPLIAAAARTGGLRRRQKPRAHVRENLPVVPPASTSTHAGVGFPRPGCLRSCVGRTQLFVHRMVNTFTVAASARSRPPHQGRCGHDGVNTPCAAAGGGTGGCGGVGTAADSEPRPKSRSLPPWKHARRSRALKPAAWILQPAGGLYRRRHPHRENSFTAASMRQGTGQAA